MATTPEPVVTGVDIGAEPAAAVVDTGAAPATTGVSSAPARARAHGLALRPLRRRSFFLLWSGGLVSVIGSWMQTVAVGALVISRTGRASWAVVIAAAAFLPIGVLSPVGGALADRIPRRAALVVGNLVAGAVAAVIGVLVASGRDGPALLAALVGVQGCVSALTQPFQAAILPDLVPRDELLAAASLGSAQFNLGRVIGPVAAGATIAGFGYPVAFVANAISFLAVVVALIFVPLPRPPGAGAKGAARSSVWASLRAGFDAARAEPSCRAAISTIAVVALLASPFIALVPAMARHVSHGSSRAIASATAALTTAQGIGAVAGALALAPLAVRLGRGRTLMASLGVLPFVLVAYGAASTLAWSVVAMFAVGLVYIGVLSGLSTIVQLAAPPEYRGRVLSFYLVALGVGYPIGSLVQGPLVDRIGIAWTTLATSGLLVLLLLAGLALRPGAVRALVMRLPGEFRPRDAGPG
jgi:MFS family permease